MRVYIVISASMLMVGLTIGYFLGHALCVRGERSAYTMPLLSIMREVSNDIAEKKYDLARAKIALVRKYTVDPVPPGTKRITPEKFHNEVITLTEPESGKVED